MNYPICTIVKANQTCFACPSQWDAWTDTGLYLYLRFRYGFGTVSMRDTDGEPLRVSEFSTDGELDGVISLEEFCRRAGIRLALTS